MQLRATRASASQAEDAKDAEKVEAQATRTAKHVWGSSVIPRLDGRDSLNWWNLPVQRPQEQLEQCRSKLYDKFGYAGLEYGYISGKDAPHLAYNCTLVPGLTDKVPEKLRGVFWMKGNFMNEELAVLQNAQWFPEERTIVIPLSPFNWAWGGVDGTKPRDAAWFGVMYGKEQAMFFMRSMAGPHTSFSITFEDCPGRRKLPGFFRQAGAWCKKGSGRPPELTFGNIAAHEYGNLTSETQPLHFKYTFDYDAEGPAGHWVRGIYQPILGLDPECKRLCLEAGGYDFVRILDGEGKPVEPWYSQYMAYIEGANLAMWSGYSDPRVLELYEQEKLAEGAKLAWGDQEKKSTQPSASLG